VVICLRILPNGEIHFTRCIKQQTPPTLGGEITMMMKITMMKMAKARRLAG
jgi:hypothetical protein